MKHVRGKKGQKKNLQSSSHVTDKLDTIVKEEREPQTQNQDFHHLVDFLTQ